MAIERLSPEDLLRAQKVLREEIAEEAPRYLPKIVNLVHALELDGKAKLPFRGVMYVAPPVPHMEGLTLQLLSERAVAILKLPDGVDKLREVRLLNEDMVRLYRSLCYPEALWRRVLWTLHLHPNPFRNASEQELKELHAFFSVCRMNTGLQLSSAVAGSGVPPLRSSM